MPYDSRNPVPAPPCAPAFCPAGQWPRLVTRPTPHRSHSRRRLPPSLLRRLPEACRDCEMQYFRPSSALGQSTHLIGRPPDQKRQGLSPNIRQERGPSKDTSRCSVEWAGRTADTPRVSTEPVSPVFRSACQDRANPDRTQPFHRSLRDSAAAGPGPSGPDRRAIPPGFGCQPVVPGSRA